MTTDWSVLSLPGVDDAIRHAALNIANNAAGGVVTIDHDDLIQEGRIWCAEHPEEVRSLSEREDALLHLRVFSRLLDRVRPEVRRNDRVIGIHRLYDVVE